MASLKAFEALVFHQQEQVNRDRTSSFTTPIWGASVDPPHTPSPNHFNLPENLNPTFCGAASFPSGNRPPGDTDAPPDTGAHQDSTSIGGNPETATPSPASQGTIRRDPSAVDLASLSRWHPHPDTRHVKFDTLSHPSSHNVGPDVRTVGGGVTLPRPSNKERLA